MRACGPARGAARRHCTGLALCLLSGTWRRAAAGHASKCCVCGTLDIDFDPMGDCDAGCVKENPPKEGCNCFKGHQCDGKEACKKKCKEKKRRRRRRRKRRRMRTSTKRRKDEDDAAPSPNPGGSKLAGRLKEAMGKTDFQSGFMDLVGGGDGSPSPAAEDAAPSPSPETVLVE